MYHIKGSSNIKIKKNCNMDDIVEFIYASDIVESFYPDFQKVFEHSTVNVSKSRGTEAKLWKIGQVCLFLKAE